MAIQILSAATLKRPYTQWFFYGKTRTGKTTAAATFPAPLFIQPATEGSIDTLAGLELDYVEVSCMQDMNEVLQMLETKHAQAKRLWDKGDEESIAKGNELFPWMTVVRESISHYTDIIQEELTDHAARDMDQQKWGKLSSHERSVHSRLYSLPVHTVNISLVRESFDQKGKLISGEPLYPGQMSLKLPSACGGVVYFDKRDGNPNDIYTAHFRKHDVHQAGVRYPALKGMRSQSPFNFAELAKKLGIE